MKASFAFWLWWICFFGSFFGIDELVNNPNRSARSFFKGATVGVLLGVFAGAVVVLVLFIAEVLAS